MYVDWEIPIRKDKVEILFLGPIPGASSRVSLSAQKELASYFLQVFTVS